MYVHTWTNKCKQEEWNHGNMMNGIMMEWNHGSMGEAWLTNGMEWSSLVIWKFVLETFWKPGGQMKPDGVWRARGPF